MKKIFAILLINFLPLLARAADDTVNLENPLSVDSVPALINNVIKAILGIVGAIALLYFVLGGFTWLTSQGKSEQVKRGRETLVWATFGLAMIFFSYVILNFVFTRLLS